MKKTSVIPFRDIARVSIIQSNCTKTLAQIKAETRANFIINGGLYERTRPVCHLRADGYTYAEDPYQYFGYAWDNAQDFSMCIVPNQKQNYICCVALIEPKGVVEKPIYTLAQGGTRGRTAIGTKDKSLCLYCSKDSTGDASTPEQLRDELVSLDWDTALMLDCGGSSQCDFNGNTISASRKVQNWICIWLKSEKETEDYMKRVCLDPGHGRGCPNKSPDGTYEEQEFAMDLSQRIKSILVQHGVQVVMTRNAEGYPSLSDRCKVANRIKDLDLFVSIHSNAVGNGGWSAPRGHLVYTSSPGETARRNQAARAIIRALQNESVNVRGDGLLHNAYSVLTATTAPAVLIEHGFHTNSEDVAQLKTDAFRAKLANADAHGILDFLGIAWKPTIPTTDLNKIKTQERFGFDDNTMAFLNAHPYATDLFRKLANGK